VSIVARTFQQAVELIQRGDLIRAESVCRQVLTMDIRHSDALHLLGFIALRQGQLQRAIEWLRQSLAVNPSQPVAHLNLANALLQRGELEPAVAGYDRALQLQPDYVEALSNRGAVLLRLGRIQGALASFQQAVRQRPDVALFHCNCGTALRELGQWSESLASFDRALSLDPRLQQARLGRLATLTRSGQRAEALAAIDAFVGENPAIASVHHDRANLLFQMERPLEALESYERARSLAPNDADIAFNRGGALYVLGRLGEALASYDRAIELNPSLSKAHHYRAKTLHGMRRFPEALVSYTTVLQLEPGRADALSGMSDGLRELGSMDEALKAAQRALSVDPACVPAMMARARCLLALGRVAEAGDAFEEYVRYRPDSQDYALGMLLHARLSVSDWRDFESLRDRIVSGVDGGRRVTLPSLFLAISASPEQQLRCARLFANDNWPSHASSPSPRRGHSKVRLAYVSADFRDHPVAQLLVRTIEGHDRSAFEVLGISLRDGDESELGQRIRHAFDRVIDVQGRSDQEVATLLREMEIDIAIDLTGYTEGLRTGIFALRLAPVQVNFLGYTGTLATSCHDYILADETVIPMDHQAFYTERVVYLPGSYLPNDPDLPVAERNPARSALGLPENGFVFCCFNSPHKILPEMFDVWMRLLLDVPGSVLWHSQGRDPMADNLRRAAEARGVDPRRLIFAPRVAKLADHLARYRVADLFLDTLPFNAHTTACDALIAGLPVLTCTGSTFAGRVATSLLSALELPVLICESLETYRARALSLATDPALMSSLRTRLQQKRVTGVLFDSDRYRQNLEAAYLRMLE
jgi:predicted O-linked N-acetylglucosamine transferase (SPINDLY family)